MRISINLATRPFVELRPLFARLRLAMAGLALTAVALGIGLYFMNARAQAAQAQMEDLKVQTSVLQNERQTNEARMSQPQNRAVLDRSKFLNLLFATKSFSWTAVMMDLERVLPAGVQVTSIQPVISAERDVNIQLRVGGNRDRVVDLVRNLERSQRFVSPRPANEAAQMQEQGRLVSAAQAMVPGGVEFEILSGYNPLPAMVKVQSPQDRAQKDNGTASPAASSAQKGAGRKGAASHKAAGSAAPGRTNKAAGFGKTNKTAAPGVVK